MTEPTPASFAKVIDKWPTAKDLARDLSASDIAVTDIVVRAWKRRGIPGEYWSHIVTAAQRRGFEGITLELLAELGAKIPAASLDADTSPQPARAS